MDIIFQYEGKKLKLPVNPNELEVHEPSSAQKVNVVGIGEVSVPQTVGLKTATIQSFFWKYLFDNSLTRLTSGIERVGTALSGIDEQFGTNLLDDSSKFKLITEYIKWIEEWRDSKKPARFTVVTLPNEPPMYYDFDVTCDDFKYKSKAGEEGDYYYTMQLLEYRHYEAKELNTRTDTQTGETVADTPQKSRLQTFKEKVKEIRVKPVDSVWTLAKKYGNGEYDTWKQLYNIGYNKNIIGNNLRNLSGQVLQMPKEWL